ncbi:ATP-dependent RNA helicase DEAH13 isoform X1 [Syzygium oleosum]|uniref:ATP-dependent RNA helicase DEAH13 isoform X1 n=1 Tax=Syzygium oleosum TaxID=219896 RepID=UPI0011D22002|nr:ATP-dependent RNA helicase DEAH13 isoform X1 [Syzygium oleosum]XP_056171768.1 ATP-dependent RNA helicase DEAH13 isoform X1 [Syzygium oleosum]XP_056171769.1 ATP-dependent RNA helicase DEAH13 isoform X1 [Syzygium oleosum]XP_056171770.1 ATP-dependent RNA helicase DEAH13 isoform X1 [Syzygium oleosum]XP_056171771.1 ATP-dependent RNA helicase DEAH13 isoform X1 [Syzygium oleosum]
MGDPAQLCDVDGGEESLRSCGHAFGSVRSDDCNAIILPKRKRKDRKGMNQKHGKIKSKTVPSPGISQKRKNKKLEEEKQKAVLLSRSMELLEKYKIPDSAYSLLQSSQNIGRAETMREKRLKVVQFSKAGLRDPLGSRDVGNAPSESERISDSCQSICEQDIGSNGILEPTKVQKRCLDSGCAPFDSSQELVGGKSFDTGKESIEQLPVRQATYSDTFSGGDMQISSHITRTHDDRENACCSDRAEDTLKSEFDKTSLSQLCGLVTTPIIVHVSRPKEVEDKRKDLPIVMMEQEIMESINYHSTVIICGETGCGKTTQVPQFLFEVGFGSNQSTVRSGIIGVTQPRRVAVLATAKRVAYELGLHLGKEVGFQVRYDKRIGDRCAIKFMTDGILLREVQNDFLLKRYSIIVLDEAHERSLNTDILIGMLSRIVQLRQDLFEKQQKMLRSGQCLSPESVIFPLKLVLMSATLRVEDFISGKRLFRDPPPVLEVPTRQYPVTIHFSKRTEILDYIGQAYKKVISINKRLPPGGILVFVTGQREVEHLCRKLRKASRQLIDKTSKGNGVNDLNAVSELGNTEGVNLKEIDEAYQLDTNQVNQQTDRFTSYEEDQFDVSEEESDVSHDSGSDSDWETIDDDVGHPLDEKNPSDDGGLSEVLGEEGTLASLRAAFEALTNKISSNCKTESTNSTNQGGDSGGMDLSMGKNGVDNGSHACPMHVLPLYAMLPAAQQLCVFEEVKEGARLVVIATNVAETSLTIPGIKYVVDTGREKVKSYNSSNGMETYEIQWISKASAAQRAGRAGRTGPGHCYRLYSSAVFNNIFSDFSLAEISKIPVDGVVLLMKSMGIDKVANFPFPTQPEPTALLEAERCLKALEALDSSGKLTSLGKAMARYPMSPRHSRMLLTVIQIMKTVDNYARASLVLGYAVAAAAALSLPNPFITQLEGSKSDGEGSEKLEESASLSRERRMDNQEKSRKKELKEAIRASRGKFYNPCSDALSIAYALQCFESSKSPVAFCDENSFHLKTMEEMSKLRKQLLQLVFAQSIDFNPKFSWTHGTLDDVERAWRVPSSKHPLQLNEEEVLGQAICAGWADRVAKRIRGGSSEGDGRARAVRYQASMVKETVFLHRWSSLSNSAPEFLVYSELLYTKRPYMHGATSVKSNWLVKYAKSLCSFSSPLTDPRPYYDPRADKVLCWVVPTFGPHLWELALHSVPILDDTHRVAVFAYALLEGQVLPCLKSVRKHMVAPPATILRPGALGQKRVGNLLFSLKSRMIDCCARLREVWKQNPMELHSEVSDCFQGNFQHQFDVLWSQMLSEVPSEHRGRFPKRAKRERR